MDILIHQSLGSEIILDYPMSLVEQRKQYELTDDNFICNVRAFIRNDEGQILMIQDKKYDRWAVPGGKVDKGETLEEALEREIGEELGVTIVSKQYIGGRKAYMRGSLGCNAWMAHYFDVLISGKPQNKEKEKNELIEFINLHYDDEHNHLIGITVEGKSLYDKTLIYDKFPGLHTLVHVLPYMPKTREEVESAPFILPENIDIMKEYQQWYNIEKKEYYILPSKE